MKRKLFLLYFCKIKIRKTKASNLSTFDFAYFADELQTNRAKEEIVGLPPETLKTLQKVVDSISERLSNLNIQYHNN